MAAASRSINNINRSNINRSNTNRSAAREDGNIERLPSFITGGGARRRRPPPQGNGQNGFDAQQQGDRFPLHRRRRRHRGPRDMSQGGQGMSDGDDGPQGGPRPQGE